MRIDAKELQSRIDLSQVVGQYIKLTKYGNKYKGCCPFHQEDTPSFEVDPVKGLYHCFGCGTGGDALTFIQQMEHIDFKAAIEKLSNQAGIYTPPPERPADRDEWTQIIPVPPNAPPPPKTVKNLIDEKWVEYKITHYWPYHNATGQVLGYDIRFETPQGKEVPPLTLHRSASGVYNWKRKGFPNLKPLYNLHKLAACPTAQVIVVEGPKKAEILQETLEAAGVRDIVTTTWPGGCNAIRTIDFSPLRGRRVTCWPDFDLKSPRGDPTAPPMPFNEQPGMVAMVEVSAILQGLECRVKLVQQVEGKPDGWDVADMILDEKATIADVLNFAKKNLIDPPVMDSPIIDSPAESAGSAKPPVTPSAPLPLPKPPPPIPPPEPARTVKPFRCLGYNNGLYYYLPAGTRQITPIRGQDHGKSSLNMLAPPQYWERKYPGSSGADYFAAASALMRICEAIGVFDASKLRGRGAWFDAGRAVLHLGDHLIVDGESKSIDGFDSKYHYTASIPLERRAHAAPLPVASAHRLREITDMLFWESPIFSTYLAGWCVVAPICGALTHRPHIWITGAAGSGKTHILENVIGPILDNFCLPVQSETSAPGVRQELGCDALPVKIDEFEAEDFHGQERVQKMLELARQAFTDSSSRIIKGTVSGKAMSFFIRSCFLFSSINVNIIKQADARRIKILSLTRPHDTETETKQQHFERLCKLTGDIITQEWTAGFRSRSIAMLPTIRKNCEIFASAIARHTGSRPAGDQVGALLAGAWSLSSDSIIPQERAEEYVRGQDWTEAVVIQADSDERKCLATIMQGMVRVHGDDLSLAEMLQEYRASVRGNATDSMVAVKDGYDAALKRHGVRYIENDGMVWISNYQTSLQKILSNTPWNKNWARLLERIPGAVKSSIRFAGSPCRAVGLPFEQVFEGE